MPEYRRAEPNSRSALYRRFPPEEYDRRWRNLRALMDREGYDAVVIHADSGFQTVTLEYLSNYEPPFATYLVAFADPDVTPTLFVGISNHLQYVREVSVVDDLKLMLHDPGEKLVRCLRDGGAESGRVGLVGFDPRYGLGMPYRHHRALEDGLDAELVDATAPFVELTATKSELELERVRAAAKHLDIGMEALAKAARPGVSEIELRDAFAAAVTHEDGGLNNAFISSAAMEGAEPGEPLPWKGRPSKRVIEPDDIVTTEMSTSWGGYESQIHRPYAVDGAPTGEYRAMFDLAREVVESMVEALRPGSSAADVHAALDPIESSRYTLYDVALHGYGNGYLHPFIGTEGSNYWPGADDPITAGWTFERGQVVVVQPNVTTPDERRSLQLGTTIVVDDPPEDLQSFPLEFVET